LKPARQTIALVAVGAGLLVVFGVLGQRSQPKPDPAAKVTAPLPPATQDGFDAGTAGLSVAAELDYIARIVGAWRGPASTCAAPIEITEADGALTLTGAGPTQKLEIGLVKPGVVRASVRSPMAERGTAFEFSVGVLTATDAPPAAITVVRDGGPPETWEPCPVK
jgi:hypothetical protein